MLKNTLENILNDKNTHNGDFTDNWVKLLDEIDKILSVKMTFDLFPPKDDITQAFHTQPNWYCVSWCYWQSLIYHSSEELWLSYTDETELFIWT